MSRLLEHVTSYENLCWAWMKAKRLYELDDILNDDLELAEFEMNIEKSLASISEDLRNCCYKFQPLEPLAHPKSSDKESTRIRQAFKVAVRDQIAWIALTNIIGPSIEDKMPAWSYGNRLYRQVFFETLIEGDKRLRFGHFRHARGYLYRPFHQSWPVYRRNVLFTARKMTGDRIVLDKKDNEFLEIEIQTHRLPYLEINWWKKRYPEAYWTTIDFRKFYSNINLRTVRLNLCKYCDYADDEVGVLLDQLLFFPFDGSEWLDDALDLIDLTRDQNQIDSIPTGLFVSGFLANVAMLGIDLEVFKQLQTRQIAQFRYVDDHTFLAPTFKHLNDWLNNYTMIVKNSGLGVEINEEKTEPKPFRDYRKSIENPDRNNKETSNKAIEATKIDVRMPTPLLTKTLAKVSMIAGAEVDLQTTEEQKELLSDIEQLLITEFPSEELRPVTRMSFAMSQMCKVAAKLFLHSKEAWNVEHKIAEFIDSYKEGAERPPSLKLRSLQSERDKAIFKQFKYLFSFIEMTLERYPDRPRLWAKAVRFCLWTGYAPGIQKIFELLKKMKDLHPLSLEYLYFFILQRINKYFLRAIAMLLSPEEPLCVRSATVRFANACYEIAENVGCPGFDHSNVLKLYSECQRTYWILSRCLKSRRRKVYDIEEAYLFLDQHGLLTSLPPDRIKNRQHSLQRINVNAIAHWYVDGRITHFMAQSPSFYWRYLAPKLAPSIESNKMLMSKWPTFLRARARNYFLKHFKDAPLERHGWYSEVLIASERSSKDKAPASAEWRLRLPGSVAKKYLTLDEWILLARSWDLWDPRRSEWTALEIVRKAVGNRLDFRSSGNQANVPLLPQNILIPMSWTKLQKNEEFYTWQLWEKVVMESTVILRSDPPIQDDRYSPFWKSIIKQYDPWEDVYASGLILLGLLRMTFKLPCSWNPPGQIRLWSSGIGRVLSELPCSSLTLSILQSTILPRNRETFVLRALEQTRFCKNDDTIFDPPEIPTIDKLNKQIEVSQSILTKHRVTVQNHKPRQLIPLSLDQIGKALFEVMDNGEES